MPTQEDLAPVARGEAVEMLLRPGEFKFKVSLSETGLVTIELLDAASDCQVICLGGLRWDGDAFPLIGNLGAGAPPREG